MRMDKEYLIRTYILDNNISVDEQLERFEIAWDVWENFEKVKRYIRKMVFDALFERFRSDRYFTGYCVNDLGFLGGEKFGTLILYKENWLMNNENFVVGYAIESENRDFINICYGIKKYSKFYPFEGSWTKENIPESWKNIFENMFEKMERLMPGWMVNDHYLIWRWFDSHYRHTWQKSFYIEVIKSGSDAVVDYYFKRVLELKDATEELIDEFITKFLNI